MPQKITPRRYLYAFLILIITTLILKAQNSPLPIAPITESDREIARVPALVLNSKPLARLAANERLTLSISFKSRHEKELKQLLADLYNPQSPYFHQWLAPTEFGERFGRSEIEFQAIQQWLQEQGLKVEQAWPNRLSISFSGTAQTIEKTFQVQLQRYQGPDARVFYAHNRPPTLPSQFASIVNSIKGLSNAVVYHTNNQLHKVSAQTQAQIQAEIQRQTKANPPNQGVAGRIGNSQEFAAPKDFATLYNITPLADADIQGQNQKVAVIINSDITDADISTYRRLFNLPPANVNRLVPPGLTKPPVRFQGEAELDTQSISAVAPMAEIDLILIPELTNEAVFMAEQFVINTARIPIVSESFGGCESDNFDPAEQMLMLQAVAQGIGIFVAAGDEGAECFPGGTPGRPAINCPACYEGVTAVGGTQVLATFDRITGDLTDLTQESVWNDAPGVRFDCDGMPLKNPGGATGGGASARIPMPKYQVSATGFTAGVPTNDKRLIPDISLLAGRPNVLVVIAGGGFLASGTSGSTPLWAAIMSLVNQQTGAIQGSPNNEIYRLGTEQFKNNGATVFRDITLGDNRTLDRSPCVVTGASGINAKVGYDAVTGWGVPNVEAFAKNYGVVAPPKVVVLNPLGNETFKSGQPLNIVWQTTDTRTITKHDISLSTDGGLTFPLTLASGLAGTAQQFTGIVPMLNSSQAQVQVTATNNAQASGRGRSNSFSIDSGDKVVPTVVVKSPNGQETLNAGSQFMINWSASDNVGITRQDITLSTDGGKTFPTTIATGLPGNAQTFLWTVPALDTNQAQVRVTAFDTSGNVGLANSAQNFTITTSNFVLNVSPTNSTIMVGQSVSINITAQPIGNFTSPINLSVAVDPADNSSISANLSTSSIMAGTSATLTLSAANLTSAQSFSINLIASAGRLVQTVPITLSVAVPDFALSFDNSQITLSRGQKANISLTINRIANFADRITVVAPLGKPIKVKFAPASQTTTGNSVSFMLKTNKSGPIGPQKITFTGQDSSGRSRTATLTLILQ